MAVEHLSLLLDAPGASYCPRDQVTGKVILGLNTDQKIRGIFVELKGDAEVRWTESESRTNGEGERENVAVNFSNRWNCLQKRLTLVGGAGQQLWLSAGEHVYPFQTQLPPGIPPSFEGSHGHVRYRAKAILERPLPSRDREVDVDLRILAVVDLNEQPSLREPARELREKTLCCLWCRSGPLTVLVQTPYTGLVPGQNVSVTVDVDNVTSSRVDRVVCRLVKKVLFHATSPSSKSLRVEDKMASTEFGSVEPHMSATWTRALRLPQELPPSGLPHCSSVIQVSYRLLVKAEVSGPHVSPTVEIPVVVGTLPLRYENPAEPSAPPLQEVPPPSYEESVYGGGSHAPPTLTKY